MKKRTRMTPVDGDVNRRQALGMVFGGAAATLTPERLAGLEMSPQAQAASLPTLNSYTETDWLEALEEELADKRLVLAHFMKRGLPRHKREALERNCKNSLRHITPDIACLRSVSLGGKCRMQIKANVRFTLEHHVSEIQGEIDDLLFRLKHRIAFDVWS